MWRPVLLLLLAVACGPKGDPADSGIADGDPTTPTPDSDPLPGAETGTRDTVAPTDSAPPTPPLDTAVVTLRLNEILADPGLEGDAGCDGSPDTSDDEFVEVVNLSDGPVPLTGVVLEDDFGARHRFPDGAELQPGAAVVVFGGGAPALAGCAALAATVQVVTASTGALGLDDDGDTVSLVGPAGTVLDATTYGAEAEDVSLVRAPELGDGPLVPHPEAAGAAGRPWSPGTLADGGGFDGPVPIDTGLTDTGADTAAPVGGVVIHELLAGPPAGADAGCDGVADPVADEFVEIVNLGSAPVDLSGATLADGFSARHVVPAGTVLAPYGTLLVFGGGAPTFDGSGADPWCVALPAEVTVAVASGGLLGLDDGGETVTLSAADGTVLDSVAYGIEAAGGESLVRAPELTDGPLVPHLSAAGASGPWSPGTLASGDPIGPPEPDTGP